MRLESMQRLAEREAKRFGIEAPLVVQFAGPSTCKLRRGYLAHAHVGKTAPDFGLICIRRGLKDPAETIKHEVAHFAPGSHGHGVGFVRARAKQGDRHAKAQLVAMGKARCPRHEWRAQQTLDRKATARGLVITYAARCARCGRTIGA